MTRTARAALAAALILPAAAPAASAEEARMTRPIEAGSLHEGPLDMVAYWIPRGDAYELVATFAPKAGGAPLRVVMALAEGDRTAFALPGHPGALYGFARRGGVVEASVRAPRAPAAAY